LNSGCDMPQSLTHAERHGLILVLSSPSGAGKTSLAQALLAADDTLSISVSLTTRPQRSGEVDGKDYHFVSRQEFERRRDAGELIEWANVFGNYYGTPRASVEAMLAAGQDILFDIDWQGARQLTEQKLTNLVKVFILPPSGKILEERLRKRGQDSKEVIDRRMQRAAAEIGHWNEYDYTVINDEFEQSLRTLKAILLSERHRTDIQTGLPDFVRDIQAAL